MRHHGSAAGVYCCAMAVDEFWIFLERSARESHSPPGTSDHQPVNWRSSKVYASRVRPR